MYLRSACSVLLFVCCLHIRAVFGTEVAHGEAEHHSLLERRDIPVDIFPQLMVVVDMNLRAKIGGGDDSIRTYMRRFISNIQSVYDSIKQPKFHFRIADIYICKTVSDCPYISKNIVGDLLHVDDKTFMSEMAKWAQSKRSEMVDYDLMMTFTSLEMRKVVNADGTSPSGTGLAGKAYLGGVCGQYNVGIATDNGGFSGIKVTAHEMAHLFGAVHDGSSGGGESCNPSEGYIMGGSGNPNNLYRPSPCTIRSIAKHVSSSGRNCLRDDVPGKYELDDTLPGSITSPNDQCKQKFGSESKNCPFFGDINSEVCETHWCYYPSTGSCRSSGAAFSGTPCDAKNPDMHCYMSYGCVHKSFKPPSVDVDLSDVVTVPTQPIRLTRPTPTPTEPSECKDAHRTHLRITTTGLMTNCTENYRLYPQVFCGTSWVRQRCCATARDNCRNLPNEVVVG